MTTHIDQTMTALRAHTRGGPEKLAIERITRPEPRDGEVLVAVHAAAVTFAELGWDLTWQTLDGLDRTPVTPSHEFSGVLIAAGPGVPEPRLPIGAEVFGMVPFDRDGAAADYVTVPVDSVHPKPRSLSHAQAAALPLAAATALQAVVRHGQVAPGQRVLVLGGAGGVGSFAVQIAREFGARVSATAFGPQITFVRSLGAEHVYDAGGGRPSAQDAQPFDLVIDTVGGQVGHEAYRLVRPGGRLVTLQGPPDEAFAKDLGINAVFFIVSSDAGTFTTLTQLIDAGRLQVPLAAVFPLSAGREAYASGTTNPGTPGKTVLIVRPNDPDTTRGHAVPERTAPPTPKESQMTENPITSASGTTQPVVFIHGLWLHTTSWQHWVELFAARGYAPLAPGWPGFPDSVAAARENPESVADVGIDDVVKHYADIIRGLPAPPIVIGHSFGGMIAEKLLGMDLAKAAVGVDAAQIKGVLPLPLSSLRSTLPVFKNPANRHKAVSLTPEQFRYSFGNAITEEESDALYEAWTIPAPGRPLFEAATANFSAHSPAKVDTDNEDRGPLLLIMGGRDHTVPEAITKSTAKQYRHSHAVTDVFEFADRGHSLTIDNGWREVAEECLTWLDKQGLGNSLP